MSNIDMNIVQKLRQTGVKKGWKYVGQIEIILDWLHAQFPVLAIFVRHSQKAYNKKKIG